MAINTAEIQSFLYCASTEIIPTVCPNCGTQLGQHTAKFFWSGQNWEVPMAYCPKCNSSISNAPLDGLFAI